MRLQIFKNPKRKIQVKKQPRNCLCCCLLSVFFYCKTFGCCYCHHRRPLNCWFLSHLNKWFIFEQQHNITHCNSSNNNSHVCAATSSKPTTLAHLCLTFVCCCIHCAQVECCCWFNHFYFLLLFCFFCLFLHTTKKKKKNNKDFYASRP